MKDYPLGTCVTRSRSIKSCRGLAQCSYYRHMSAADHATVRSVHTVHSTPHDLMCLHWHCPVACGDIRHCCRTCCCRGQGNNGWLLLSCHLLSVICKCALFNLQFTQQHQHRISLGGPVCAEPVYHLHHYIAVIIMAMSHVMCSVVIMARV